MNEGKHIHSRINAGEDNPRAKLKEADVKFIREKRDPKQTKRVWSQRRLADYFNVSKMTIVRVERKTCWGDV